MKVEIQRFWFVTWPHNRCVTWLCRWGPLILSYHPAKFGERFLFVTWPQYLSVTWLSGLGPPILSHQLAKFWVHRPCESRDTTFLICFVTWPRGWCVTWLCRWGPLILSHHPAKFTVDMPCESGDKAFFICHVTTILKCHVTLWVGSAHPKSPSSLVWVHWYYGTGNNGVCCISSNSSSNSNAEVPMPRFINGHF